MKLRLQQKVFAAGSTTYFNSSAFFPAAVRRDVESLYAFVRLADDFVDADPQDEAGFRRFAAAWRLALVGWHGLDAAVDGTENSWQAGLSELEITVIGDYVELGIRKDFEPAWTEAFLRAMESDLAKSIYATEAETLEYVYGSAEVIGLFMARILGLPAEASHAACLLGRAMQYINFIRDVDEDRQLGRRYLPLENLKDNPWPADWLPNETDARNNPEAWKAFVEGHLTRYRQWQAEAVLGYSYIPRRPRAAIRTAGEMYDWTGSVIAADPFVVFRRKVKPSKGLIVRRALKNLLFG